MRPPGDVSCYRSQMTRDNVTNYKSQIRPLYTQWEQHREEQKEQGEEQPPRLDRCLKFTLLSAYLLSYSDSVR